MKRILIPTDFSIHAGHTIESVLEIFRHSEEPCRIILLNTYIFRQTDRDKVMVINDELRRVSREGLQLQKDHALKSITNPNITIDTVSQFGSLKHVVLGLLQKGEIDLVAFGKNEAEKMDEITPVLRRYNCPLIIAGEIREMVRRVQVRQNSL